MLNSKQRSNLRSLAAVLKPIGQVGKGGVSENLVKGFSDALEARELIKVTLLPTAAADKRELSEQLATLLNAELVAVIGRKAIYYRRSSRDDVPHVEF